jgi:2-enoate reductase
LGKEKSGENIVVVGGGLIGCETALYLSRQGKNVTVIEISPEILEGGNDMCFANYDMLKDLMPFNKIAVFSDSSIKTVNDDSVVVKTPNGEREIPADTIILALGYHSQTGLYDSMRDSLKVVYNVGDSRNVHNIMYTIWDANQLARGI